MNSQPRYWVDRFGKTCSPASKANYPDVYAEYDEPVYTIPDGWQLVPKLLTPAMHTAIVRGAGRQDFISWPANCWEGALEVAPVYKSGDKS